MRTSQNIIKYLAIALAFFIIFSLFSGIINLSSKVIGTIEDKKEENKISKDYILLSDNVIYINQLKIEIDNNNLEIKEGNEFKVYTNDSTVRYSYDNNNVEVISNFHWGIANLKRGKIIVYIPNDFDIDYIDLNFGASKVKIERLSSNRLDLDLGVGTTTIDDLNINSSGKITSGAGNFKINNANLANIDLKLGIGNTTINGNILGDSTISTGVGKLTLNLNKNKDNYKFDFNDAIGNIKFNGEYINEIRLNNNGSNHISINGGIGNIDINTK